MKRGSTLFLKTVLALLGLVVAVLCAFVIPTWSIQMVESNPDLAPLRFPFLTCVYLSAVPFFFALYQAAKLLGNIDGNDSFSESSVRALKNIKYSAVSILGIVVLGELYVIFGMNTERAHIVSLGLVIIFGSTVIATFAAVLQRLIETGVDIQSENDLTV